MIYIDNEFFKVNISTGNNSELYNFLNVKCKFLRS